MKIFLPLIILVSLSEFAYCKCVGRIEDNIPSGIMLKIQSNQKDGQCWTNAVDYIYQLTENENNIFIKLLPPTGKIVGKRQACLCSRPFAPWRNMGKKANNQHDFRRDNFAPIDRIKKGQKLIIDIPCLDEKAAKEARPFNISNPSYPTLRCEIAPADKEYFSE